MYYTDDCSGDAIYTDTLWPGNAGECVGGSGSYWGADASVMLSTSWQRRGDFCGVLSSFFIEELVSPTFASRRASFLVLQRSWFPLDVASRGHRPLDARRGTPPLRCTVCPGSWTTGAAATGVGFAAAVAVAALAV